jgi:hypothetical protein
VARRSHGGAALTVSTRSERRVRAPAARTLLSESVVSYRAVNGTNLPASLRGSGGGRAIGGQKANLTGEVLVSAAAGF